MEVDEADIEG